MLTRNGVLVIVGSVLLAIAGRVLGLLELFVLAATGFALVAVAVLAATLRTPALDVSRSVHPLRVHAGTPSRVELVVRNVGARRSPVLMLHDQVTGTAGAHLLVVPMAPRTESRAAYRLPTDRRGLIRVGPLSLEQSDPFGLARRVHAVGRQAELTVLPRVIPLLPVPYSQGHDPLAGADQPNHLGRGGDEFYALRPYVIGDDMRHVHWPSTARTGELQVRQVEQPWQGRVAVLLDTRRATASAVTFEEMVTAAASILTASRRRGDLVRLCTTDGFDSGFVAGHAQIDAVMEHLAVVELDSSGTLAKGLSVVRQGSGTLVAIISEASQADLDAIVASRARSGGLTVVQVTASGTGADASIAGDVARRGRIRIVRVTAATSLADAWNAAMHTRGPAPAPLASGPVAP